jgi:phage repressor protein C with HTH and peptisase S24 domain
MRLRHNDVWRAIDKLAKKHGLSTSGLARKGGLDPTAFNRSKRFAQNTGKPRWPSTETVEKLLCATGERWPEFVRLMGKRAL